jgi:hypothetical protein
MSASASFAVFFSQEEIACDEAILSQQSNYFFRDTPIHSRSSKNPHAELKSCDSKISHRYTNGVYYIVCSWAEVSHSHVHSMWRTAFTVNFEDSVNNCQSSGMFLPVHRHWFSRRYHSPCTCTPVKRAPGNVVGWGTMLQAGRSRVRFQIRSLIFFLIGLILLTALWAWDRLSL